MGDSDGDVGRLRQVLELCAERHMQPARVRVGSVELVIAPSPSAPATDEHRPPTPEELRKIAEREYFETMYNASLGDLPIGEAE